MIAEKTLSGLKTDITACIEAQIAEMKISANQRAISFSDLISLFRSRDSTPQPQTRKRREKRTKRRGKQRRREGIKGVSIVKPLAEGAWYHDS